MRMMKMCFGLLLAVLVTTCLCRPAAEAPPAAGAPPQHPPSPVRRDWAPVLSQKQRLQPHIFAELGVHKGFGDEGMEELYDHYYPAWMDFGRRSAGDAA
ncbi:gastrin/cholecystokinin-like peptide [Dryobates pubescens]|uniref:gastrin/cholecystokinin-like peptide n=1 Tax=Dryobates pubescens TaxID=118200 RepID=UPI0023B926D7|nr:gastrin/cholecystokinin-like peptide [Dryobates pubescens]